jgi:isoleucyl-tRNA synthetase
VQSLRKERGLNVTDRIRLYLHGSDAAREAVESYEDYLTSETLAVAWEWARKPGAVEAACGEEKIHVDLEKVAG